MELKKTTQTGMGKFFLFVCVTKISKQSKRAKNFINKSLKCNKITAKVQDICLESY